MRASGTACQATERRKDRRAVCRLSRRQPIKSGQGGSVEVKRSFDPVPVAQADTFAVPRDTAVAAGGAAVAVTAGTAALSATDNILFTPTADRVGAASFSDAVGGGHRQRAGGHAASRHLSGTGTRANDAAVLRAQDAGAADRLEADNLAAVSRAN